MPAKTKTTVQTTDVGKPSKLPTFPLLMNSSRSLEDLEAWAEREHADCLYYFTQKRESGDVYVGAIRDAKKRSHPDG